MDPIALELPSNDANKKRRMELPLKKRSYHHRHESESFAQLSILGANRSKNASPIDDRASSDDSALPKTPQSSSSSSVDVDDCSSTTASFPLDFTLPSRSRAKSRSIRDITKKEPNSDQDQIDHGFESASTSSVTSIQEEPLDLTEKLLVANSLDVLRRSMPPESNLSMTIDRSTIPQFSLGLFGSSFLPFPVSQLDPNYPNLYSHQSITNASTSASISKRSKIASSKQSKKIDNSKIAPDYSTLSPINSKNQFLSQIDDQFNNDDDDLLLSKLRRNYKNMTVERRMEANARERTRVHTIGAAFDRLRKLIPSSTSDQKLSKLSILRIACRYIMLLASMNGNDYSLEQRGYTVEECIDMLTDTINVESKFKRVP